MIYLLLVLLAGCAVKCDDSYFVVEAPEDHTENHERPFNVYWNVPTMQCRSKKIPFKNLYEKYGIHQNKDDSFRGDKISILYDPGLFPALLENKTTGTLHFRNGGVPQEGDLELHVKTFKSILNKSIPDPHFNGVGIIDFEWWRPIFRQNMGNLVITKNISIEIQMNLHWEPDQDIHKEARLRFEKAARTFMKTTLSVAKQMRPNALWGYYGFPYCFNMANKNMKETCADKVPEENDRTRWLWSESTALYPSVYSSKDLTSSQLADLIRGRVKEAQRVKSKGTAVLPYFWFRYREGGFLSEEDLNTALETLYKSHASGFIIWGSSEDVNTVSKCKELRHYVENTLGPAISAFTKAKTEDEILQIKAKKKAPHHKLTEKSNHTYREVLDIYWKPPENCVQDIKKYVEEELQRKGYTFININQAMTNVNYSIHIKIPFNSLKKTTTTGQGQGSINETIELKITETIDSSSENSVTELLKDIQNTSDIPSEKTSQISRKMIILKKLLQIQQLTKEILALEVVETIDLKDGTPEHSKVDSSTKHDDVMKDEIELTSKLPASLVVLNNILSTVDITPTEKLDKQASSLPTENVSNEIVLNGTAPSFKTSTENVVPKLSDHQSSRSELSQSYENSNKTSSGDHSIVKLQEDSEDITKRPILETTQTVELEDVTRDDLITDVTTIKDNLKGENIEVKPLPTESINLNDILSITESPTTETIYTLPTENVINEIMSTGTGPIEDLVPKLLEKQTSSTESTDSYENPDKTSSGAYSNVKLQEDSEDITKPPILETTQTVEFKDITRDDLITDVTTVKDNLKGENIEVKPLPTESINLNDILSITESPTTETIYTLPTENVINEIMSTGTGSIEDLVPKLLEKQTSSTESTDSYENPDKTSSGAYSNVKLQEDSEDITKPPILETTQTVEFKDITRDDLITDVTTVKDNLKGENIEVKPLPTESINLNDILSITESPTTETIYTLPTENVINEIMSTGTGPIADLVPKLLEIQTSSTESTNSYENPNKTFSTDDFVTHLTNHQTTTEIPILKTINLKNDTQKDLNINFAALQNDTKKEVIDFELKLLPIENLQLNNSLYYNVEVSTIQSHDTQAYSLPTESVSNEIIVNDTRPTLKTNTEDFTPELIGNYTSSIEYFSTESTHSFENSYKTFDGEESVSKLLQNTRAIEIPISESTQRNYFNDQKHLGTDVTTSQGDLKEENIELPLQPLPIETLQLNNTLYYSKETPTTETQDKLTLEFPTENVSKEIITNEWKPILKPGYDNLDANLLENQTYSVASTQNYVNFDKTSSGENIGLNLFLKSNQSRLEVSSTEISTERPEISQTSSTEVLAMKLLENEEITTEIPNIENGETIYSKNDNQERFNADVAKEQVDLKTGEIEMGLKTSPTEFLDLNDTLSTDRTTINITSNRTEPLFKISMEDILPKLLENQTSDTTKLTTESTKSFENSNKTVRGEYLVAKVPQNDQATTEIPTLETTVLMNDTQKSSITEFSDLQDGIKQEEI